LKAEFVMEAKSGSLARAGVIVMFLNGLAIVAAFAREATIAYYYGASAELDAFWVALSVPRMRLCFMLDRVRIFTR